MRGVLAAKLARLDKRNDEPRERHGRYIGSDSALGLGACQYAGGGFGEATDSAPERLGDSRLST